MKVHRLANRIARLSGKIIVTGNIIVTLAMILSVVPLQAETYTKGDTIYLNEDYELTSSDAALYYGIVNSIDTAQNAAAIRVFTRADNTIVAAERRVASGQNSGLHKGTQRYFYPNLAVKRLARYILLIDEESGDAKSQLTSDKSFHEDGKTLKEEITFTNVDKPNYVITYTRKCYYPSGVLRYEEIYDERGFQTHYYNEQGKEIKKPKQDIEPLIKIPEFPGGQKALFKFLSETVKYPTIAKENNIQGRVVCQFVVNKDGSISDVVVLKSSGEISLDKEAVRVLKSMPKWKPGIMYGKPVRVKYTAPVNFKL